MPGRIRLVEFDRARNTAQNGSKFTGITFVRLPGQLGIIPMNSTGFTPILSSISCPVEFEIRPGMKYCLKWVEIHGFTPNSTGHEILLILG